MTADQRRRLTEAFGLANTGHRDQARALLESLHGELPEHAPTMGALGQLCLIGGRQIEALQWLKRACLVSRDHRLQCSFAASLRGVCFGESGLGDQDTEALVTACLDERWDRCDEAAGAAISLLRLRGIRLRSSSIRPTA